MLDTDAEHGLRLGSQWLSTGRLRATESWFRFERAAKQRLHEHG
jgi:hypothetical protein